MSEPNNYSFLKNKRRNISDGEQATNNQVIKTEITSITQVYSNKENSDIENHLIKKNGSKSSNKDKSLSPKSKLTKKDSLPKIIEEKSIKLLSAEDQELIMQATKQVPQYKENCSQCSKSLIDEIRIIGASSKKEYCINCLVSLEVDEDYHVVDKLNFPIFNSYWTVKKELELLSYIEKFGIDNWDDIATKLNLTKFEIEAHYYNYYLKSKDNILPDSSKIILNTTTTDINKVQEERNILDEKEIYLELLENKGCPHYPKASGKDHNNNQRSLIKNRFNKNNSVEEILGYLPRREEFDTEFLNDAELEVAEVEFFEEDTPDDIELKIKTLEVYNLHLDERNARKKFILDNGLLNIKKKMREEKSMSKEDLEISLLLKPFARFYSKDEYNELLSGLIKEKNLIQYINQLRSYSDLGFKTYSELEPASEKEKKSFKKLALLDKKPTNISKLNKIPSYSASNKSFKQNNGT